MYRTLQTSAVLLTALSLLGCDGAGGAKVGDPVATGSSPDEFAIPAGEVLTSSIVDAALGSTQESVGVWWLERDTSDPGLAQFTIARQAAAQGDLYELSIRPFITADSLRLLSTSQTVEGMTDYLIEFRHPIPMPANLERPASATKRTDLFLFDVQAVLVSPGEARFFNNAVTTNTGLLVNADGYRHLAPMVQLSSLGITDGTNTFPYKLLYTPDEESVVGNYQRGNGGWNVSDLRTARGYDVVPQGSSAQTLLRVPTDFTGPVGMVLAVKYMDPRGGLDVEDKRSNRLPDPGDFGAFAYAVPEACGDLQITSVMDNDGFPAKATNAGGSLRLRVLDWDNETPVAGTFPNLQDLSRIRQPSAPASAVASIPDLDADTFFPGAVGDPYGRDLKFRTIYLDYQNNDYVAPDPLPADTHVPAFIQLMDAQDVAGTSGIVLSEQQLALDAGPFFNARYQFVEIPVNSSMRVAYAGPRRVSPGHDAEFRVEVDNGPATAYLWTFGAAATNSSSSLPAPVVTVSKSTGNYQCSVRVYKGDAYVQVPFELEVMPGAPVLPTLSYNYASFGLPPYYADPAYGEGGVAMSSNMPLDNITSDAGATLGRVLFYDPRLSQNYTTSCGSCHKQEMAFSDNVRFNKGFDGAVMHRNSMGLVNCRYYVNGRMFADERADTLEEQALMPIQNEDEMGMTMLEVRARLQMTSFYTPLFAAAFGDSEITDERIGKALAQFMRSIVSYQSKYDVAMTAGAGGTPDFESVFSDMELNGLALFQGHPSKPGVVNMQCNQCHATAGMIQGAAANAAIGLEEGPFKLNNGLGVAYYEPVTDVDMFKSSSLRNIEVTGPYMHDGRFTSLEAVVSFYSNGVQSHPNLHPFLRVDDDPGNPAERFNLSDPERGALVAFMKTLTDNALLTDPKYSDPFPVFD